MNTALIEAAENPISSLPVKRHWFANLMQAYPDSAAGRGVPLVVFHDMGEEQAVANFHRDFYSLYIVRRGRGTHVIDGKAFGVARGDVYAMVPGMTHHFENCHEIVTDTLHFSPDLFATDVLDALSETPGFHALFITEPTLRHTGKETTMPGGRWLHLTPAAYDTVADAVDELHAEWQRGDACGALLTRGLFFRLLVKLAREYAAFEETSAKPTTTIRSSGGHEATVAAAVRYMDERFIEPVRIEEVARAVFLSADRFTEVFSQAMGRTPRDYLRYLRVERAKSLLLSDTDSTMTEVAQNSGFGDPAYFTRVFRATVGCPPSEWRRQMSR